MPSAMTTNLFTSNVSQVTLNLWMIVCMVVSNLYKGEVTIGTTAPLGANPPTRFSQILNQDPSTSGIKIYSTTNAFQSESATNFVPKTLTKGLVGFGEFDNELFCH